MAFKPRPEGGYTFVKNIAWIYLVYDVVDGKIYRLELDYLLDYVKKKIKAKEVLNLHFKDVEVMNPKFPYQFYLELYQKYRKTVVSKYLKCHFYAKQDLLRYLWKTYQEQAWQFVKANDLQPAAKKPKKKRKPAAKKATPATEKTKKGA